MNADDNIVTASTYRLAAVSFWESAKILHDNMPLNDNGNASLLTVSPFYFLVSHACELFLKSALLKRGALESDLKKLKMRHSLKTLSEQLEPKGVALSPETKSVLNSLNKIHEKHSLRYNVLISCDAFKIEVSAINAALQELLMSTRIRPD